MDSEKLSLAEICDALPLLRVVADDEGWGDTLREQLALAKSEPEEGRKALASTWKSLGILGDSRSGAYPSFPVVSSPPPRGTYRCPRGVCARQQSRIPSGAIPECNVFSSVMTFEGDL